MGEKTPACRASMWWGDAGGTDCSTALAITTLGRSAVRLHVTDIYARLPSHSLKSQW